MTDPFRSRRAQNTRCRFGQLAKITEELGEIVGEEKSPLQSELTFRSCALRESISHDPLILQLMCNTRLTRYDSAVYLSTQ